MGDPGAFRPRFRYMLSLVHSLTTQPATMLTSSAASYCHSLAAVRTAGLQRLSTTRMPSTRDEEYRFTDVSAILKQEFVVSQTTTLETKQDRTSLLDTLHV